MLKIKLYDMDNESFVFVVARNVVSIKYLIEKDYIFNDATITKEKITATIKLRNGDNINCKILDTKQFNIFISFLKKSEFSKKTNRHKYYFITHLMDWDKLPKLFYKYLYSYYTEFELEIPKSWQDVANAMPKSELLKLPRFGITTCNNIDKFFKEHGVNWK